MADPHYGFPDTNEGPLRISARRESDSVALVLSGELDLASADELGEAIRRLEETNTGRIVVDLADVSFIDSTGLSVLMAAKKRSDGRFSVSPSPHEAVARLLELTGTVEILTA